MLKNRILPIPMGVLPGSYAVGINMSLDENYVLSAQLVDQNGNPMGTAQTVDLPEEAMIINAEYDANTQSLILTLQNGNTLTVPLVDLISGLQEEITTENPLSADLLTDGTNNKVFTAAEQTKLSGIESGAEVNVQANWNESNSSSDSYIQNKPDVATLSGDNTFTGDLTFDGNVSAFNMEFADEYTNSLFIGQYAASQLTINEENENYSKRGDISPGYLSVFVEDNIQQESHLTIISPTDITIDGNAVVTEDKLATVATTGDYTDLSNTPTIPTVNDATITLQDGNGTALGSFTTNDANNQTITIPAGGGGNEWFGTQAQFDALSSYDADTDYFISDKIDYNTDIKNKPNLSVYAVKTQVDAKNSEQDSLIANKMEGKFLTEQQYSQITPKEGENYFIEGNTVQMEVTFADQTTATYNIVVD